jgi:hypothetical protein
MMKRLSLLVLLSPLLPVLNSCTSPVDPVIEARLKQEVAAFNSNAQKVTDSGIRMDSASTSGMKLRFNFTLLNNQKSDFDSMVFAGRAKADVLATLSSGANAAFFRDNGIRITYNYYDRNSALISTVAIQPEDYDKQAPEQ